MQPKKEQISPAVQAYIRELRSQKGITIETIASDLKVSYAAVAGWSAGRACPNFPTIKYLEFTYGGKIL